MLSERILKLPGFLYQIGNNYYYLGKWICKECTDQAATDCVTMYQMCRAGKEEPETNTYFQTEWFQVTAGKDLRHNQGSKKLFLCVNLMHE